VTITVDFVPDTPFETLAPPVTCRGPGTMPLVPVTVDLPIWVARPPPWREIRILMRPESWPPDKWLVLPPGKARLTYDGSLRPVVEVQLEAWGTLAIAVVASGGEDGGGGGFEAFAPDSSPMSVESVATQPDLDGLEMQPRVSVKRRREDGPDEEGGGVHRQLFLEAIGPRVWEWWPRRQDARPAFLYILVSPDEARLQNHRQARRLRAEDDLVTYGTLEVGYDPRLGLRLDLDPDRNPHFAFAVNGGQIFAAYNYVPAFRIVQLGLRAMQIPPPGHPPFVHLTVAPIRQLDDRGQLDWLLPELPDRPPHIHIVPGFMPEGQFVRQEGRDRLWPPPGAPLEGYFSQTWIVTSEVNQGRVFVRKTYNRPEFLGTFQREAWAAHFQYRPMMGLPTIYEVTTDPDYGNMPCLIMELIEGETLLARLTGPEARPLDLPRAIPFFIRLCSALEYLHDRHVLHCDVALRNVMVTDVEGDLHPTLIDLGICERIPFGGDGVVYTRNLAGFEGQDYRSAPEQRLPDADERYITRRTDVFHLGWVMAQALTGGVIEETPHDDVRMWTPEARLAFVDSLPAATHAEERIQDLVRDMLAQDERDRPFLRDVRARLGDILMPQAEAGEGGQFLAGVGMGGAEGDLGDFDDL
jgi:hypothetical protein